MVQLIDSVNKVAFDLQPKFHYLRRSGSITLAGYRPELRDMADAQVVVYDYVRTKYPELAHLAIRTCVADHLGTLNFMFVTKKPIDKQHKKEVIRFLRNNRSVIFNNPYLSRQYKLFVHLSCIHDLLYKLCLMICYPKTLAAYQRVENANNT